MLGCGSLCGCLSGSGKLRDWFTYTPLHLTPPGEWGAEPRIPEGYTYFLDVPCRENWKPTCCDCNKSAGACVGGACGSGAPTPRPMPLPALPNVIGD
jgi:hypothetical protein